MTTIAKQIGREEKRKTERGTEEKKKIVPKRNRKKKEFGFVFSLCGSDV